MAKRNIALIGMPGVGKSSVGKALAGMCGLRFIDSDLEIEKRAGCSVADIFARHGEERFRSLEKEIVKRMSQIPYIVLSCGGGTVMNPDNAQMLKENSFVIYLSASQETLVSHVGRAESRPLLKGDTAGKIAELMAVREPVYRSIADLVVECDGKNSRDIAAQTLDAVIAADDLKDAEIRRFVIRALRG